MYKFNHGYNLTETDWYGNYDREKYEAYRFYHNGLGNVLTLGYSSKFIDAQIAETESKLYLDSHGMDYSHIVNPGNLPNANSDVVGDTLNFVSSNILRLYGNVKRFDSRKSRSKNDFYKQAYYDLLYRY